MIPKTDSIADKIGHYLHKFGKCSLGQLRIGMAGRGVREDSVEKVSRDMLKAGQIQGDPSGYEISDLMRKHYDYSAPEVYKGEIVQPREAPEFRPLTSLPWAQHLDKLRDISFKTGGTSFVQVA
jgi:hypothetical protein